MPGYQPSAGTPAATAIALTWRDVSDLHGHYQEEKRWLLSKWLLAWLAAEGQALKVEKVEVASVRSAELATMDEMELFYDHLEKTLVGIGFLDLPAP